MKEFWKKFASPFVAVGRWVKDTAWVQPLLIVGVIFAIIFSIPSISKAIQEATAETDIEWYALKQLSLDGTADKNSAVNTFFEDYVNAQDKWSDGNHDEARNIMKKYSNEDRFILFFVQSDCSTCEDTQEAAEYLVDNWDALINNETSVTYMGFSYQSIICDQVIENNEKYEKRKAFEYLYGDPNYYQFIYDANTAGTKSNYYRFGTESSTIKSNLENLVKDDEASSTFSSNFQTPMIVEINLTEDNKSEYIISNILYKLIGDDVYERSDFLVKLWKRKDVFSDTGK